MTSPPRRMLCNETTEIGSDNASLRWEHVPIASDEGFHRIRYRHENDPMRSDDRWRIRNVGLMFFGHAYSVIYLVVTSKNALVFQTDAMHATVYRTTPSLVQHFHFAVNVWESLGQIIHSKPSEPSSRIASRQYS
jgi:hypothetical protein